VKFACAASDTLAEPLGSAAEGMVAAALEWLQTGACPEVMATPTARAKAARPAASVAYPRPRHPSAAQWWLPGVE
jgi:hypothetical protein